jgi:predicted PurR-regulated permease PerM
MHISFQKAFYALATVVGLFAILILAKSVLIPIAFAFLIAFILFPMVRKLESWGANDIMSSFLSILAMLLVIAGSIFLFSNQILQLSSDVTDFKIKILDVFADVSILINNNVGFLPELEHGELFDTLKVWLNDSAGSLLSQTFSGTAGFVFGLLTTLIFTFLILLYKDGLVRAFVHFYAEADRPKARRMFKSLQEVGQKYLFGMIIIMLVLGLVNSIGLWIIGLEYPFLFGFLAAALAIIPYAGTILGAMIPILYAFITVDSALMPVFIAIFFWVVQFVESNFLSPKIVGGHLRINALASILSIIIGASVWGIAGMILFLPFTAMLMVVCEEYEELKPIAMLIGEQHIDPDSDPEPNPDNKPKPNPNPKPTPKPKSRSKV